MEKQLAETPLDLDMMTGGENSKGNRQRYNDDD